MTRRTELWLGVAAIAAVGVAAVWSLNGETAPADAVPNDGSETPDQISAAFALCAGAPLGSYGPGCFGVTWGIDPHGMPYDFVTGVSVI